MDGSGLTFSPDGKFVYVGGGSQASVFEFSFADGKLAASRTFEIVPEKTRTHRDFIGDVAVSPDGRLIYAAGLFHDAIHVINPQSGRVIEKFATGPAAVSNPVSPGRQKLSRLQLGGRRGVSPQRAQRRTDWGSFGSGSIRLT